MELYVNVITSDKRVFMQFIKAAWHQAILSCKELHAEWVIPLILCVAVAKACCKIRNPKKYFILL